MSKSIKELRLHYDPINASNTFTSGDVVEGRVVLKLTKEIKVDSLFVKLTGDAKVHGTTGSGDNEGNYSDHERYFKLKQYFINSKKVTSTGQTERNTTLVNKETYGPVIRPGTHVFSFRFQLPQQNMPPSFKGRHGWVKYVLTVKLIRPWRPTSATELNTELNFVLKNDGTNDHLLQPQSGKKIKHLGSGKMSLTVTAEKTAYMQGETISVFVDIDNSLPRHIKLKYSLKRQQMFITKRSTKTKMKTYIVKETKDCIPSGEKSKFIVDMPLPRDLTVTIENCRIIKVQYELKVSLGVSFASDPAVRFPVVILSNVLVPGATGHIQRSCGVRASKL